MFNLKLILKFFLNPFCDMTKGYFPSPQFGLNSKVKLWRHTETVPERIKKQNFHYIFYQASIGKRKLKLEGCSTTGG